MGYSQDQLNHLTVDPSWHILNRDPGDRFLFTDCDTLKGDSGSPLLVQDAGGYQVIGVVSGIFQSKRGRAGTVIVSAGLILRALAKLKILGGCRCPRLRGSGRHNWGDEIGLPELVTYNLEDYEALALKLATQPDLLGQIKRKLAHNRLSTPLFDCDLFRRHIEAAYPEMWSIW